MYLKRTERIREDEEGGRKSGRVKPSYCRNEISCLRMRGKCDAWDEIGMT